MCPYTNNNTPDSKVHGGNMGPTWVLSVPDGPMLAPWTLLSGTALVRRDGFTLHRLIHDAYIELRRPYVVMYGT